MTKSVDVYLCKSTSSTIQPRGVYEWYDDGVSFIGTYQGYVDYWSKKETTKATEKIEERIEDKKTLMQRIFRWLK